MKITRIFHRFVDWKFLLNLRLIVYILGAERGQNHRHPKRISKIKLEQNYYDLALKYFGANFHVFIGRESGRMFFQVLMMFFFNEIRINSDQDY